MTYMNRKLQSYAEMSELEGASRQAPQGDIVVDPLELEGADGEMEDSFQQEVKGMDNESLQERCSSLKDSSKK